MLLHLKKSIYNCYKNFILWHKINQNITLLSFSLRYSRNMYTQTHSFNNRFITLDCISSTIYEGLCFVKYDSNLWNKRWQFQTINFSLSKLLLLKVNYFKLALSLNEMKYNVYFFALCYYWLNKGMDHLDFFIYINSLNDLYTNTLWKP